MVVVSTASGDDAERWREAARLRDECPGWVIIWLARTREYRAYQDSRSRTGRRADRRHRRGPGRPDPPGRTGPPMTTALGHWRDVLAAALIWRHIPAGRRDRARGVAFKILDDMRAADGTLARARTVCSTVARLAPPAAGGGPGG